MEINNLTLQKIYEGTIISESNDLEYKGVYTYICDKLEKQLFQIYKQLTKNNPVAQAVLLCNKETSNEEITTFLYRAILCQFNSCFIVGGVEFLKFDTQNKFLEVLNNLYDDRY